MSPEIQKLVSGLAKPSAVQKSRNTLGFWILDDGNGLITSRTKNGGLDLVADGDEQGVSYQLASSKAGHHSLRVL